jgi:hypothetical protein
MFRRLFFNEVGALLSFTENEELSSHCLFYPVPFRLREDATEER